MGWVIGTTLIVVLVGGGMVFAAAVMGTALSHLTGITRFEGMAVSAIALAGTLVAFSSTATAYAVGADRDEAHWTRPQRRRKSSP
jgi:hypothetical protein